MLLHYLHLSTAVWGFIYVFTIYNFTKYERSPNLRFNYILAYIGPAVYVMVNIKLIIKENDLGLVP